MELSQPTNHPTQSLFPPVESDRPPYSYKELIIKAFELVKSKPLELRDIYFLISGIFPYYKPGGAWQSAVRHVLFSDPMFLSDPRTNLWRIISNLELQTPQFLPSQPSLNANIFENQYPVSASSLLMSNSFTPTLNTDFDFYRSSENNRNFLPYTQNSSVHTISSYTTSQPRMSSFETSNRWTDGYRGTGLQEVSSWPSATNYRSNLSSSLVTEQSLSGDIHRDCQFLSEHNSGHLQPVKPNVRRAFLGSNYDSLSTFTPLSSYPVNTNSNIFLGRRLHEENSMKTNSTLNKQNEGAFNFYYSSQNNSSDCKYSEMRNEESRLNTLRNFSLQKDFASLSTVDMAFFSNPQNSYPNNFPDSFCPYGYFDIPKAVPHNQISNQLISVNIHAPPCSHQTQNHSGFDLSSVSSNSLQSRSSLCNTTVNDASFTNHVVSSLINAKTTENSASCQNSPCIAQRNVNSQCPENRCNANVNVESPTLSSISDFISNLSVLSSSINTPQNTLESAAPIDKRRKTNWETSLININIHLSALENADRFNITSIRDKPASDTQLQGIPSNSNAVPAVRDIGNQEDSTDCTALYSSVARECSDGHDMSISELNSVAETTLSEPANVNTSVMELIVNKSSSKDTTCSVSATQDSGNHSIVTDESEMALITCEAISTKLTGCTENNTNDCVKACSNSTEENCVKLDHFSTRSFTSKTSDEFAAISCNESLESNVEDTCEETQTCSNSDTGIDLSAESLLIAETRLPEENHSVSMDYIPVSPITDSILGSSTNISSKNLNQKSVPPSTSSDVESNKDLELTCLETLKTQNKVKQCRVILERIKLPVANLNYNSKLFKKDLNKICTSSITSLNNDKTSGEFVSMAILPGNNPSLVGEGLGSRLGNSGPSPKKCAHITSKNNMPLEINGFTKPSYNYCRLITQALATAPERKATALQICDMIAKKHPYYEHLTDFNWRGSIYKTLRTRKKFFTIVGTDEKNEFVWSFNSTFEEFMLDKWVPKFVQKKSLSSSIQTYIPWLSKTHPQQYNPSISSECSTIVTSASTVPVTASSESQSPVIVFSGTLMSTRPSGSSLVKGGSSSADPVTSEDSEKDPLGPEDSLLDPSPIIQSVSSVADDFEPWEPEVTVNEDTPNYTTQQPNNILAITLQGGKLPSTKTPTSAYHTPYNDDFSLHNLNVRHVIHKEEIIYRVNFNKEHQAVEKFRLHCTVCDDHLGTSGTVCRRKVRLHSMLGVLVCSKCYKVTCNPTTPACLWCAKAGNLRICCVYCKNMFCQTCLERNFGPSWCASVMSRRDWRCFKCDTKQIWPHRAIAYFLFRHYREIRKRKEQMSRFRPITPRELRFFIQDLSTCCKSVANRETQPITTVPVPISGAPLTSVASVLSSNFIHPVVTNPVSISTPSTLATTSVPSQPPIFVIGEQSPNYIYVQTPSSVPSVTLNTGTQYIHNVYPDKNYVVVDNAIENRPVSSVITTTLANTILYSQAPSTAPSFPVTTLKQPTEKNLSPVPEYRPPPPYPFPNSPTTTTPPYFPVDVEVTPVQNSSNDTIKVPVSNTSIEAKADFIASKAVENNSLNTVLTSTGEIHGVEPEKSIIIPDVDPPEELKIQEEKVTAVPILSARERIESRPMPKSKKQSLLRTVLMSESIESMKRHLHFQSEPNISTDNSEISVISMSPKVRREGGQNIEEPILKSIIETATERLLNLQRNQNVSSSTGNNFEDTRPVATVNSLSDTCIDLIENESSSAQAECEIIEPPITLPKIKIKTLKELQDPEIFNVNHNIQENHAETNEEGVYKESDVNSQQYKFGTQEVNKKNVTDEAKINITDLKQGIIEASRTLINTQKQFKELAKIISSNLIYKPDQAVELITKFHDILKSCHQELDQIDGNVNHQFGHLIPNTDNDSVMQLMKKNKEGANPTAGPVVLKKRKKRKRIFGKKKSCGIIAQNVEHSIDSNAGVFDENEIDSLINDIETDETLVQSSIKRKRDLLDFNPLGKKVILGSPDVTEEDLRRIPNTWDLSSQGILNQNNLPSHNQVYMEELRRRQYLARKGAWKKKNIWLNSKRKKRKYKKHSLQHNTNGPLMYNEDGSLMKKRPYKKRRKKSDSDDDADKTYRPNNSQHYPLMRARRRSSELSRPLRLSARMHPSTVAHVAQLMSFEQRGITHLIKPCSVVLDRLDPKTVQILERDVVEISDSDDQE